MVFNDVFFDLKMPKCQKCQRCQNGQNAKMQKKMPKCQEMPVPLKNANNAKVTSEISHYAALRN